MLVPTGSNDEDVTEVLQLLEQELAAYEEEDLAAIREAGTGAGRGRGRGRGGRGVAAEGRHNRLEIEDLVDLARETRALARWAQQACM